MRIWLPPNELESWNESEPRREETRNSGIFGEMTSDASEFLMEGVLGPFRE
jgi:hypothetical protein